MRGGGVVVRVCHCAAPALSELGCIWGVPRVPPLPSAGLSLTAELGLGNNLVTNRRANEAHHGRHLLSPGR